MQHRNEVALSSLVSTLVEDAQCESCDLGEDYISTEHLLLALVRKPVPFVVALLQTGNLTPSQVHEQILLNPCGRRKPATIICMTPRAERILQTACTVAKNATCDPVAPHHLLAALLLEGEGLAARVLRNAGLDAETLRQEVTQLSCD